MLIYDPGVARKLEAVFADDLSHFRIVTYETWARRGIRARMFELLVAPILGWL